MSVRSLELTFSARVFRSITLTGALAALTLATAGCAHRSAAIMPPAEYMRPCKVTESTPSTNGELFLSRTAYKQALAKCDDEKTALREWRSTASKKFK